MTFIPGENEDREECRRKRKLLPTLFDDDDFITMSARDSKARRGVGENGHLYEGAEAFWPLLDVGIPTVRL